VVLGFITVVPFSPGHDGLVRIHTNKDRPARLTRPYAAELVLHSDLATHAITWEWRPSQTQEEGGFRPTVLMERVSRFIELRLEPANRNLIETSVKGKAEYLRVAMDCLVEEGFAKEMREGRTRLLEPARAFREADDEGSEERPSEDGSSPVVPARPALVQDEPPDGSSRRPLPQGGTRDEPRRAAHARVAHAGARAGARTHEASAEAPAPADEDDEEARPLLGDDDFLPWLYARLERGVITEGEWHQADQAHRLVVAAGRRTQGEES
jgi:hypothetical protein